MSVVGSSRPSVMVAVLSVSTGSSLAFGWIRRGSPAAISNRSFLLLPLSLTIRKWAIGTVGRAENPSLPWPPPVRL